MKLGWSGFLVQVPQCAAIPHWTWEGGGVMVARRCGSGRGIDLSSFDAHKVFAGLALSDGSQRAAHGGAALPPKREVGHPQQTQDAQAHSPPQVLPGASSAGEGGVRSQRRLPLGVGEGRFVVHRLGLFTAG